MSDQHSLNSSEHRSDTDRLSFIIRIWIEESAAVANGATWRGHITHIPDGERRYFQRLTDLALVIGPYLIRMGVRLSLPWRIWIWLSRR
jgi:hypothetical protein